MRRPFRYHGIGQKTGGLTALDLLIGLAVVALVISLGVPALREFTFEQRIRAAVQSVVSGLTLARNTAISRNGRTVVCPATPGGGCADHAEWHTGWLVFADLDSDREWQSDEPVLRRMAPYAGIRATSSAARNRLRFFPTGSAPGSNASIVFCDARGTRAGRRIVLSASGRIRRTPAGDTGPSACPG